MLTTCRMRHIMERCEFDYTPDMWGACAYRQPDKVFCGWFSEARSRCKYYEPVKVPRCDVIAAFGPPHGVPRCLRVAQRSPARVRAR